MIVLKTILKFTLKFTLKHLRSISVQSHLLQRTRYPCLLKLTFVKIVNYFSTVYEEIGGDVATYIASVLVGVCVLHW